MTTSTSRSEGADRPAEGASGDHDHHRSRWPIVGAAGAGTLYVGIALLALAYSAGTVPPTLGASVAVVGVVGLIVGLAGWLHQAFFGHSGAAGAARNRPLYVHTMRLFLMTDLGTFGAFFVYYVFIRTGAWPPTELPAIFGSLVLANTAILLASSVTFHVAHTSLEGGDRRRFLLLLGATVGLGAVFLAGQAFEYYEFLVVEGFTLEAGIFASAFYGLTGLHGLHVALGVVLLSIIFARGLGGEYSPERDTSIATVGLYWHFVDAVWIVLVVTLYAGSGVGI